MPPPHHRKKPFSAKQKKLQLKERREERREWQEFGEGTCQRGRHRRGRGRGRGGGRGAFGLGAEHASTENTSGSEDDEEFSTRRMNQQPQSRYGPDKGYDPNRYRLHFQRETRAEIEQRKAQAREHFQQLPEEGLEMDLEEIYQPGSVLDMPKRPPWNYRMSKAQLEAREETYFRNYLENILEKYSKEELSYFELNVETWRQLWRVLEISDIILLITDIRHPALHFSPALYEYVTKELKKPLILVLNKIDLAPPPLVVAWKHYFHEHFPDLHIVCFTSFPKDSEELAAMQDDPGSVLHKKRKKMRSTAAGPLELLEACKNIVQSNVDLSSWRYKIEGEASGSDDCQPAHIHMEEHDGSFTEHERYKDGVLTIGCCGYPNVGKSSLMNGLVGKKVVSVSRTPGHTKHFQTIFLTPTVKLCDSPGLVFPSLIPKPMQILAGIYPIAQVREPYTPVGYLSQRIPVTRLLRLRHPDDEGLGPVTKQRQWSALDVCDAWAAKRRFLTAKAARNDVYRAANNILRMAVESRLVMCMRPPGYTKNKGDWENHPETEQIATIQKEHCQKQGTSDSEEDVSLSEEEHFEEDNNGIDSEKDRDSTEENSARGGLATNNPFALLEDE